MPAANLTDQLMRMGGAALRHESRRGRSMTGQSDQGQLLHKFRVGNAVAKDRMVRKIDSALDLSGLPNELVQASLRACCCFLLTQRSCLNFVCFAAKRARPDLPR